MNGKRPIDIVALMVFAALVYGAVSGVVMAQAGGGGAINPVDTSTIEADILAVSNAAAMKAQSNTMTGPTNNYTGIVALDTNVWYVPLGTDLDAFISGTANAGDTLFLASGDYTITDDIDVTKALTIRGQKGQTRIVTTTDSKNALHVTVSDVTLQDLIIDVTANGTRGVYVDGIGGAVLSGVAIIDCTVTLNSHDGIQYAIYYVDAGGEVRDCLVTATSGSTSAYGIYYENKSTAEAATTLKVYGVDATATAAGSGAAAGMFQYDNSSESDCTLTALNSSLTSTDPGAGQSRGAYAAGGDAIAVYYGCVLSGSDYDVRQYLSASVTLRGCMLVNGTTDGTITYGGTIVGGKATYNGEVIITNAAGHFMFEASTGDLQYINDGSVYDFIAGRIDIDAAGNAVLILDKNSGSDKSYVRYETNGVAIWHAGTTDSDSYGDGDEYFIGTASGGADPAMAIDPANSIPSYPNGIYFPINGTNWLFKVIDTASGSNAFQIAIEGDSNTNVFYLHND